MGGRFKPKVAVQDINEHNNYFQHESIIYVNNAQAEYE